MAGLGVISDVARADDIIKRLALPAPSSPGIYSRLERAVEAMPPVVPVQDLPGLIKRHKEGVPGWELRAVDLDSVVGDAKRIPRQDLLDAVRERSPVHTHGEVVLGGRPQTGREVVWPEGSSRPSSAMVVERQQEASRIGRGVSHGSPKFKEYSQGGDDYTELLLTQPGARGDDFGSHWYGAANGLGDEAVAHARFDTHGDALRINEIQSDLANHNIKRGSPDFEPDEFGGSQVGRQLPFPLEDAYRELLIKRLTLEAARQGHRAIEIADPRAIAKSVGMNADHAQHLYGKVIPSELERLGRKMGGLVYDKDTYTGKPLWTYQEALKEQADRSEDILSNAAISANGLVGNNHGVRVVEGLLDDVSAKIFRGQDPTPAANELRSFLIDSAVKNGWPSEGARILVDRQMPAIMRQAENITHADRSRSALRNVGGTAPLGYTPKSFPGRRYIMSDAMRRNIIQNGIGASVLGGMAAQQE